MNKIIQGDCLEVLKTLSAESVDCVITSPPYWALRDYGVEGQLGLEPTFQQYITQLCDIFDEVKRVLKKEGTCWVNIGDTYGGSGAGTWQNKPEGVKQKEVYTLPYGKSSVSKMRGTPQDKCLLQIPSRFSIEMTNRGWILRNSVVWHKPNAMPSSVTDRFSVDYEMLYFFVKSKKYYFEQQFEDLQGKPQDKERQSRTGSVNQKYAQVHGNRPSSGGVGYSENGRNKRSVWTINTKPYKEAHFATYPEALIETPIKAGCPEGGVVLDMFFGSGTTGAVAKRLGRNYIGIELNPEYIKLAKKRIEQVPDRLFS